MSYNIDSIDIVASDDFGITPEALALAEKDAPETGWPESNVFAQVRERGVIDVGQCVSRSANIFKREGVSAYGMSGPARWVFTPGRFWFTSDGSGWAFDALLANILPRFTGRADLVVCWEGGDSFTGLRVVDGKVTKHEVVRTLGKEIA